MSKPRLTITVGLPASGKTTWAREQVALDNNCSNGKKVNICKDDIRDRLFSTQFNRDLEDKVDSIRDILIRECLQMGLSVICSDTNLSPSTQKHLNKTFSEMAEITYEVFDTPLGVCIERDSKRENPVGAEVILDFYERYLAPKPPEFIPSLPNAIIVDIDGTIAHGTGRHIYDFKKVDTDRPDPVTIPLIKTFAKENNAVLIFLTGRPHYAKEDTQAWLEKHFGLSEHKYILHTRTKENTRTKDYIFKKEYYFENIAGKYNVLCVFEDRLGVCRMWHSLGLKLLRLGNPDNPL